MKQLIRAAVMPGNFRGLHNIGKFLRQRSEFVRSGGKVDVLFPILSDYKEESGSASGHYFHQDLLVAQLIHAANPTRHVDIGSRIDGFVAHVAAFRQIDVLDIRPLQPTAHANINFVQADLMQAPAHLAGRYDSVSCLHALEHFGLGRYGDPVNADGHLLGFSSVLSLLAPGGVLYLSVPIGKRRVEFNAHRVFDPSDIPALGEGRLTLERFDYVGDDGALRQRASIGDAAGLRYGCGIYTLRERRPA